MAPADDLNQPGTCCTQQLTEELLDSGLDSNWLWDEYGVDDNILARTTSGTISRLTVWLSQTSRFANICMSMLQDGVPILGRKLGNSGGGLIS